MNRRGFALLLVLWTLVPVSALLLGLSAASRADGQLAANLRDAARLQAAADGGVQAAIFALLQVNAPPAPLRLTIGDVAVSVDTAALAGLVNPNVATPELLRALLVRSGAESAAAEQLAAAILDWRTRGENKRPNGAKLAEYRAAGRDYGPPGEPFETLPELRDVLGMTPAIYAALRPSLTLFTREPPNPALASDLVRAALADLGTTARPGPVNYGDTFRIIALAQSGNGGRARREAVVALLPAGGSGRGWRVLDWELPTTP